MMIEVVLEDPADLEEWRNKARGLLRLGATPDDVSWRTSPQMGSLFAENDFRLDEAPIPCTALRVPSVFLEQARNILRHCALDRHARLYDVLWRLQRDKHLLSKAHDPAVIWMRRRDKEIRRDLHKMHAFVRFRKVGEDGNNREAYAAWFEPDHLIIPLAAPFFVKRFYAMNWAIITPHARAVWHGEKLSFGPGGSREDVPDGDIIESQWTTYYCSIFNPARVKVKAMKAEMPQKYWRNLPEAASIGPLLQEAQQRVRSMKDRGGQLPQPLTDKWRIKKEQC